MILSVFHPLRYCYVLKKAYFRRPFITQNYQIQTSVSLSGSSGIVQATMAMVNFCDKCLRKKEEGQSLYVLQIYMYYVKSKF